MFSGQPCPLENFGLPGRHCALNENRGRRASPVLDEVILESLVRLGAGRGEAALHQGGEPVHPFHRLHGEEEGVAEAELRRGAVGLGELGALEQLQAEGEDALAVAGQTQGGAAQAGQVPVRHLVLPRELARHRQDQLARPHDDVAVAAGAGFGQASHQVGRHDLIVDNLGTARQMEDDRVTDIIDDTRADTKGDTH